ncbi:MAG: DNA topoisomerase IB [Caulobacterales bacterium]
MHNAGPRLVYVSDKSPGLRREGQAPAFHYQTKAGRPLQDQRHLARIRSLVIPPAWSDVWIAPEPNAHLQATGRDARGRKQYIYHPQFREAREQTKFERLLEFVSVLPRIRTRVAADMRKSGLPREKVIAAVVSLLESTLIRVGNESYAKENKSYGLTTLRNRHAEVQGAAIKFNFKGKSGRQWRLQMKDRRVANIVRAAQELPGQYLFQYEDGDGRPQAITSADINDYLRDASGRDVTAKDFRTWAGTVLAAQSLAEIGAAGSETAAKRNLRAAIDIVSKRLGNTPTICRKCYVHPAILEG